MNIFLLLAKSAETLPEQSAISTEELILNYVVYFAIIVLGLVILGIMRKKGRLPTHTELRNHMSTLSDSLDQLIQSATEGSGSDTYHLFKRANKIQNKADKLFYYATMLSDKEKDSSIGNIALILDEVRNNISAYRYDVDDQKSPAPLYIAAEKLQTAINEITNIIDRDNALKTKKASN